MGAQPFDAIRSLESGEISQQISQFRLPFGIEGRAAFGEIDQ